MMTSVLGIDIGGTFTDLAAYDAESGSFSFTKSSTTPSPDEGAGHCLDKLRETGFDISGAAVLKHGTTVVINSILERKGARTALVTTEGFRDMLEIGRGNRPEPFNLFFRRLPALVPRNLRLEISERMSARGDIITPLDRDALPRLVEQLKAANVEAVAVCFLHAYRNPAHEREVAEYIQEHLGCFVTASHALSREFREYERTSTAVVNAFVGPRTASYVERFRTSVARNGFAGQLLLMGSNGGVLTAEDAIQRPILLVESGPVGGAAGSAEIGRLTGHDKLVAFDMGGTTAKAVLLENGEADVAPLYYAAGYARGYPIQAAVLDIVEVGTGGGSIAAINELGALSVGPRSAGAVPGPACYGNGGTEPTITDANLVLGRLNPDNFLDGEIKLDVEAARRAIGELAARLDQPVPRVAAGILKLATLNMAQAVKMTTIERGHDPREFAMVAYGGAGPLHATAVARELGTRTVIIPRHPGHFCAYGMLYANLRYDLVRTVTMPLPGVDMGQAEQQFHQLEQEVQGLLKQVQMKLDHSRVSRYADMRYQGQEHTLKIRLPASLTGQDVASLRTLFEEGYQRRYGHSSPELDVDVVTFRVAVEGVSERPDIPRLPKGSTSIPRCTSRPVIFDGVQATACDVWQRDALPPGFALSGPAIIEESASTTVLLGEDTAVVDEFGNIVIKVGG